MKPDRTQYIEPASRQPLHGDASSRRYFRLHDCAGNSAIEVRYPEGERHVLERDLEVLRWLRRHGLRMPRLLSSNVAELRAVLEDLGPADAEATLVACPPEDRLSTALALIRPLEVLAKLPVRDLPPWNTPLSGDRLRWELAGFELWFIRYLAGQPVDEALTSWLDGLAAQVASHPFRICHRDYHLNNLFFLGCGEVGVIDAQDLLVGPDTYDAASLLYERRFPELFTGDQVARWLEHWARATAATAGWQRRVVETRAQRGLKVLGTFARLVQCGRGGYGRWMVPVARSLAPVLETLDAPPRLVVLLLDWSRQGGSNAGFSRTS